jgi:uncharacterized protein (DUF1499 family)
MVLFGGKGPSSSMPLSSPPYGMRSPASSGGADSCYWMTLGCMFVMLGTTHCVLSIMYHYWLGVAVGFSLAKTGLTAIGMSYVSQQQKRLPWILRILTSWGSSLGKTLLTAFRIPLFFVAFYVTICIGIRLYSPDSIVYRVYTERMKQPPPVPMAFPESCKQTAPSPVLGCHRLTLDVYLATSPSRTASVPHENDTEVKDVHRIHADDVGRCRNSTALATHIQRWALGSHTGSTLIDTWSKNDQHVYMRIRVLSTMFGFADDWMMYVSTMGTETIRVQSQGQLRLGISDIGVNKRRNDRLESFLQETCSDGGTS